jgi:hypothetical protein
MAGLVPAICVFVGGIFLAKIFLAGIFLPRFFWAKTQMPGEAGHEERGVLPLREWRAD